MYDDEKNKNQVKSESEKNQNNDDDKKSWAEEAKQELEDFIESQGIYIRQ